MSSPIYITHSIKRLCDLETGSGTLAKALSEAEKRFEIARLRSIIPGSILGHHDRMLQRGKRTILPVFGAVCPACEQRLSEVQVARLRSSEDLEVCDGCGTFIYFESIEETKTAGAKDKRLKEAVC
jgi:predicted  nucleic acid-binding Zn-ribbon protein